MRAPSATRGGAVPRAVVLIVDDDEAVRRLLELLLKTSGYDTVTATNGVEALEQMRRDEGFLPLSR